MLRLPPLRRVRIATNIVKDAMVGALIASFIFSPLTPAFAQSSAASDTTPPASASVPVSSSSGTSPPSTATPTPTGNSVPTASAPAPATANPAPAQSTPNTAPTTPATAPAAPPATQSAPQPSGPLSPGAQTAPDIQPVVYPSFNQNQVKIDKNTGALNTTFPIDIPPGRNHLQPDLDLVYNSQSSQQGSIFGEGWSISIPYIERLNKSGVDKLYSTSSLNYFSSSLDGEIVSSSTVTSTASSYIARTENGAFNKYTYTSSTNQWLMTDKNGTQYTFGSSTDALQNDPNNASNTFKWMLKQVKDTNNNVVTYNYTKDAGQIYPSSTLYTGTPTSTGIFEVDFQLATTTTIDNATSSATGFAINSNYRVSEIDAKSNGTWVRKYILGYTVGDNGYTTLLGSIAESGQNASGTVVSLPSSTFNYQLQTSGWTSSSTWNPPAPFVGSGGTDDGVRTADVNGDGLSDIVSSTNAWANNAAGWGSSSTWNSPVAFTTSNGGDNGYRLVDVTGSGKAGVVSCNGSYVNNGSGWTSSSTWNTPVCFATNGVGTGAILADVNGDGLPDILYGTSSSTASSSKGFQLDTNGTLTTSLKDYYKLEDANDYWSTNNLSAAGTVAYDTGKVINSAGFGTSTNPGNYLYINSNLGVSGNVSFSFWVKINAQPGTNGEEYLIEQGNASDHVENLVEYRDSGGTKQLVWTRGRHGTANDQLVVAKTLTTGTWYHIAYTYDGTNVEGWVNDVSQGTKASSGNGASGSNDAFALGAQAIATQGSAPAPANIDEAAVWNKKLSNQEIADLYDSGSGQTMITTTTASTTYAAYLNTGSGWATSTIWTPPVPFVTTGGLDAGTRIVDVNGDGLADIVQGYTDASGTIHDVSYLNTGNGWATSTVWTLPTSTSFVAYGGWDNGFRIADVNGDGLPDLISNYTDVSGSASSSAYLNTGHGWTSDAVWLPPTVFSSSGGYDKGARVLDVLGNGLPAVVSGYSDALGTHYAAWVNDNATRADLLTSITYPQGGNSTVQYKAAAQFLGSGGTVTNRVPYPVYAVSNITTSDGSGNTASALSYQYASGTYYYNSPTDHEFAGFGLVAQTDAAGNVTKSYYHTSNGTDSAHGEYNDNFWKIGKPYRIENYDNANNLYKKVINRWDSFSLGGNAAFVKLATSTELDYDGLSTHKDSATTFAYDNTTGNQTQKVQWGQVNANDDGTFTDTGSDEYTTNYTFASSTASNVIGKISDETLTNQSSTKIQETQYYYDGLALGNVSSTGNLTKQQDWKSSSTYVTTVQNTYNGYGLVTQSLDPRNDTSTFSYDAYNLYPATSTNALSQTTGYQYDYSTGKPTQVIDPNKLTFQTTYDGFGRPLTVLQPDQVTTSTLDTKATYTYTDTANAVSVHESDYLTATSTVDSYRYYD